MDFVRRLGWATGRVLAAHEPGRPWAVLAVRDTRASGPPPCPLLADGLGAAGYALLGRRRSADARGGGAPARPARGRGAVLSASHNPAPYNGIKLSTPGHEDRRRLGGRHRAPRPGPGIRDRSGAPPQTVPGRARVTPNSFSTSGPGGFPPGFPIVLDCAHGAASTVAPALFRRLGARVTVLSAAPNGRNINRGCGALHPEALARAVRRHGARLGVAFDGDADRAIFVDETGRVRDGDAVLLVTARALSGPRAVARRRRRRDGHDQSGVDPRPGGPGSSGPK
ncbi:MAG: hypothetical protein IPK56_11220 [Elusimicrobia bacterium]|nr:hypothetical protein [Elusimicrobiota bacterium]